MTFTAIKTDQSSRYFGGTIAKKSLKETIPPLIIFERQMINQADFSNFGEKKQLT